MRNYHQMCVFLMLVRLDVGILGLPQVVENWNATNDFIFYGNGRIFGTNKPEDMEIAMLCLHLVQISMVYINTLMIQELLADPGWMTKMTAADLRAITPLLHSHVTPYGHFILDMNQRLVLAGQHVMSIVQTT